MADPRKIADRSGVGRRTAVYAYDSTITYSDQAPGGSTAVDLAVTLTGAGVVGLADDGDFVLGQLLIVEDDGFCTVQEGGHVKLPRGTGAALTVGGPIVGDLLGSARGYIRDVNTGEAAELAAGNGRVINAPAGDGTPAEILL
jgi:hypothetical protein